MSPIVCRVEGRALHAGDRGVCAVSCWLRFFAERVEGARERQQAFAMRTRNAKYSAVHMFRAYRKGEWVRPTSVVV